MRGKRKPVYQHKLAGTFRKDRHNETVLQPLLERIPEPPIDLSELGRDIYYIEAGFLNSNRLLNIAWTWQIAIMSMNIAIALQCADEIKTKQGKELVVNVNGQAQNHPTLRLMWKAYGEAHKIAVQLGITPVSFSKFKIEAMEEEAQDPIEEIKNM